VGEPRTDFETIYSDDYYKGQGADPLVNFYQEFENPALCIRRYEWKGLLENYSLLSSKFAPKARWLDYGCGLGTLGRYGLECGIDVFGYDPYGKQPDDDRKKNSSSFIFNRQEATAEKWDFVSAIEVLEHAIDPLATLSDIRSLLKKGGVFYLTTWNAKPFRKKLTKWAYTSCPDVHVSFFEPETMILALEKTGFRPFFPGYLKGDTDILKFKILKNLNFTCSSKIFGILPWFLISRVCDLRYHFSAMPIGIAT
jgi:SAM-dependent methyltransferase